MQLLPKIMWTVGIFSLTFLLANASPLLRRHVRVVGGRPADITEFPYQVSVLVNNLNSCGGSIISKNFIITAAHCIDGETTQNVAVQVGSPIIGSESGDIRPIKNIFEHPKFSFWNYDNDIAVLQLVDDLKFDATINIINLPEASSEIPAPGTIGTITGWGVTQERSSNFSSQLLATDVPILSFAECSKDYSHHELTHNMICAGYKDGKHDSCLGDSGGPLAVENTLIGVIAWGYACGETNHPGVYTSVIATREFIKNVTGI